MLATLRVPAIVASELLVVLHLSVAGCWNHCSDMHELLHMQEVSTYHTDLEAKLMLAAQAIDKFRRSIRLRPDFDHGCYNLGTVFYTHASTIRNQLRRSQAGNVVSAIADGTPALHALVGSEIGAPEAVDSMMGKAAQFIIMAWALQPNKDVYVQSVRVVQAMLPKPFLRVGYLKAPR